MGLGSNLTLDATFFPDFGQVEVDPAVINLTDTETIFPERRPFFTEGSNLFNGLQPTISTPGASKSSSGSRFGRLRRPPR